MSRVSPASTGNRKSPAKRKPASRTRATPRGRGRRSWQPSLTRKVLIWGLPLTFVASLGGAGFYAWHSGWAEAQAQALRFQVQESTAAAGLAVAEVLVVGRERAPAEEVLTALQVARGTPMMSLNPAEARARLEALPWVKRARVERRLPDTVYVQLEERRPLALWQHQGQLAVIDQDGDPIAGAPAANFAELPVVVGETARGQVREFLDLLALDPGLAERVVAGVWVGERRWNLRMDNGIDVQLPEQDPAAAWLELARMEQDEQVLNRQVAVIDLRLPDRLVVRLAPEGESLAEAGPGEEET